jgi:hypothetical protein
MPTLRRTTTVSPLGADLVISGFGLATSALTVGLLAAIERRFEFAFYAWTFWFVIPVGAIVSGLVAASGYVGGALLLSRKPTRVMLAGVTVTSVAAFFAINYLQYAALEIGGRRVAEALPFWRYLDLVVSHQSVQFSHHGRNLGSAVDLGRFGYAYALLQIAGFGGGGAAAYLGLRSRLYCDACARYYREASRAVRYCADEASATRFRGAAAELFRSGKVADALALHAAEGGEVRLERKRHQLSTSAVVRACPGCRRQHLTLEFGKKTSNGWQPVAAWTLAAHADEPIVRAPAAKAA